VNPTGDDTNDGLSWATAKKTITSALTVAQGLDEVWVSAGTYTDNVSIPAGVALYGGFASTETRLTERNWSVNPTIVDGGGSDTITSHSHGQVLDGLVIVNGDSGIYVDGGTVAMNNCILKNNGFAGALVEYGTLKAVNCVIIRNELFGIALSDATATVSNCTISGNVVGVSKQAGVCSVTNCIIIDNESGISGDGDAIRISHNNVHGNTTANYEDITDPTGTIGNISVDPLFVDRDNGDYHLQSGSPCIDTGDDSVVTAGQTDMDGKPRISGAHVDMGAYEFIAGTPPYALSEAVEVLKVGAGLLTVTAGDMARADVDADGGITIIDAARIARKVAGLDANP